MYLTESFVVLLLHFQPVFTQPSFATFQLLMSGWILSVRHRYITDLIVSSDSVGNGHFSDYHRFFSRAVWDIDQLWKLLAQLVVKTLVGNDATIVLAGDDTLCRKRGLGIYGTGMHHDALNSSKSKKLFHWGHDWVDLCIVIVNPWWAPTKVFALPVCMRLYRNKQGLAKGKNKVKIKRDSNSTVSTVRYESRPGQVSTILLAKIVCFASCSRKTPLVIGRLESSTAPMSIFRRARFFPYFRTAGPSK